MKVLATTDGSEFSLEALRRLGALVPREGTEVQLLTVYPSPQAGALTMIGPPYIDYTELTEQVRKEAEDFATQGAQILTEQGFQVVTAVREGDPAATILDFAAAAAVDMIVVGSHGRSGLARFFLGSVSSRVVSHAHCSVLVVKHSQAEARR